MTTAMISDDEWTKKNQQYLTLCIKQIKNLLNDRLSNKNDDTDDQDNYKNYSNTDYKYKKIPWDNEIPIPAIESLSIMFGLSNFERSVLILCAAVELDYEVSSLCTSINGGSSTHPYPTFSLALSVFPDAHWSAIAPISPLRKFRLVDLVGLPQVQVTKCQLQIQERILHYLIGLRYVDSSLEGIIEPVRIEGHGSDSHKAIAENIIRLWKKRENPLHIQLIGPDETSNRAVAGIVCNSLGINLWQIASDSHTFTARRDRIATSIMYSRINSPKYRNLSLFNI